MSITQAARLKRLTRLYDPWLALAFTLAILGLISTPLFRAADVPNEVGHRRSQAIDGLRGFAALGVFFHHAVIKHDYVARGVWQLPPSRFYSMIGQVGVSVFFLITGYLFWTKLIRERGRPNWPALYLGRIFRIGPVYAVAMIGLLVAVTVNAGGEIREPLPKLAEELARWISLGILSQSSLNGDPHSNLYLAGVVWSLQYEWAFYAALVLLSVGAQRERWALPFTVALATASLLWRLAGGPTWIGPLDPIFSLLFAVGMACASLEARGLAARMSPHLMSAAALALVVLTFALFPVAYALAPTALLCAAFYLVVSGGDVFGLLRSRAAQRLGTISFGLYMLQGLALTLVFAPAYVQNRALRSEAFYWAVLAVASLALLTFATLIHLWVERPGIEGGRKFIRWIFPERSNVPIGTVTQPDQVRR